VAKALVRKSLGLGIGFGLNEVCLRVPRSNLFAEFFKQCSVLKDELPPFAMLAGNPQTDGQRFVFLLFDSLGNPTSVVKAGAGPVASRLIQREATFLRQIPAGTAAVPILRSVLEHEQAHAFALDFVPGNSPSLTDWPTMEKLLTSWLSGNRKIALRDLPSWQTLENAAGSKLPPAVTTLSSVEVRPAIFHGDFAPWNIKVHNGAWTLLDWERGELTGVPGWDWLHFVVQTSVLVQRASTARIVEKIERLFISQEFVRYAQRAGITRQERAFAIAYLHYCLHVLKQTEGFETIRALAELAERRWCGT
jgi:hypothetical protein